MRAAFLAAALAVLGAGEVVAAQPVEAARTDAVILPETDVARVLDQCSRDAPKPGEGAWRPGWTEVDALKQALPAALAAEPEAARLVALGAPKGWSAQYVGIVRDGRRYVYANFFPANGPWSDDWRTQPILVCDGGTSFFGVEYDVAAGRITQLAFNGSA
ncbi:hypothetical protein [Caulobacter sp. 17J65-9]|uniref:hypothetical protein n=1 Tax=Caulobacter sp. 17J65-9 TaxID=2709382 RepID=UPI0013C5DDEE|nr:hypothetical protein [Caulobacter sp. 17J65-9]NEX95311.1 hypothetical protein [Caulobacter sp. 17J65-9]